MLEFLKIFIFPYISFGFLYLFIGFIAKKLSNKFPRFLSIFTYTYEKKWLFWTIAFAYLYLFYKFE